MFCVFLQTDRTRRCIWLHIPWISIADPEWKHQFVLFIYMSSIQVVQTITHFHALLPYLEQKPIWRTNWACTTMSSVSSISTHAALEDWHRRVHTQYLNRTVSLYKHCFSTYTSNAMHKDSKLLLAICFLWIMSHSLALVHIRWWALIRKRLMLRSSKSSTAYGTAK